MGIDWMAWDDLREAIPPAYTHAHRRAAPAPHRTSAGHGMTARWRVGCRCGRTFTGPWWWWANARRRWHQHRAKHHASHFQTQP
jgi:hypothetical protein